MVEIIARGVLKRAGKVLLCQNVVNGYFYLPGGHVEFGESARGALAREFMEECGCRVRVKQLAAVSEGTFTLKRRVHHEVNLVFHVEQVGKAEIKSLEPKIAFAWLAKQQIRKADVRPASAKRFLLGNHRAVCFDSDVK